MRMEDGAKVVTMAVVEPEEVEEEIVEAETTENETTSETEDIRQVSPAKLFIGAFQNYFLLLSIN